MRMPRAKTARASNFNLILLIVILFVTVHPPHPDEINGAFPPQECSSINIDVEDNPDVCSPIAMESNCFLLQLPSCSDVIVEPVRVDEVNGTFPPQECSSPIINVEDNPDANPKKIKEKKRESTKLNRMRGKSYIGYRRAPLPGSSTSKSSLKQKRGKFKVVQDVTRGGPPCTSKGCHKFKNKRKCSTITEEKRTAIFKEFWTWSWETKRNYVRTLTETAKPRRLTKFEEGHSQRKISYYYYLNVDGEKIPVCKPMFLSTLGCTVEEVRYWLGGNREETRGTLIPEEATMEGGNEDEPALDECHEQDNIDKSANNFDESHLQKGQQKKNGHTHGQSRIARRFRKQYLDDWLEKLPKLPSHYIRKDSKKMYLQTDFRSMAQVYEAYANQCLLDEVGCVGATHFAHTLDRKNIAVFTPRKDRCDTCSAFEMKNLSADVYEHHIRRKEDAQREKNNDKQRAENGEIHAIVCDMMKVQCLPLISASAAYYKLKLSVHNFTVYNLGNRDVMSYWFDKPIQI
ncbi:Hypothetical protein NTJ_06870 [Nesidiocoris tenuis]|uniref:Uncharacterized protein n=2 Tax=Nesidiocoris tenuis TaxID=355587 RepID=A0ABN7APC1_9HEMI|nr:Hypothetical protein NTJ_06870 [Nesidiocoris tenuis]